MIRYELIVYWSKEDNAFVVEVPELPGCMADGPTPEQAAQAAQTAIRLWIEAAHKMGRSVPRPARTRAAALKPLATVAP